MSRRLVDGKLPVRKKDAAKGGRPNMLELDPSIIPKVEAALRMGAPVLTAMAFNGISYDTVRLWVIHAKQNPESIYGELFSRVNKAIAEWEMKDISVIEAHAMGRPAQYEMEVVRDKKGKIVFDENKKPLMQVARDAEGNPILKSHAIKSDWKAALERMSRRKPASWARRDQLSVNFDQDAVLSFDNSKVETKEAMSFEQAVAKAMEKFDEEY
jgi:hypothetical protein